MRCRLNEFIFAICSDILLSKFYAEVEFMNFSLNQLNYLNMKFNKFGFNHFKDRLAAIETFQIQVLHKEAKF